MFENYVDVATRLRLAHEKYPDLRVVEHGYSIVELGNATFLECVVWVYPTPDDERPVRGSVLEPWPGKTPYTKDSELAVGMTSALGRALGYLGFGIQRGIASTDEIQARRDEPNRSPAPARVEAGSRARRDDGPKPASAAQAKYVRILLEKTGETLDEAELDALLADRAKTSAFIEARAGGDE